MRPGKFKAVVIGCGNIGTEIKNFSKSVQPGTHAGAYVYNKKITLSALVDIDKNKLARALKCFPRANTYTDVKEMLLKEKPDIVSIATPPATHKKNTLLCAKAGVRAILCEKPIATNLGDAKDMIEICKKNKVYLFINHQRHFDPLFKKWNKKIKNGLLGTIFCGNAYYYNGLFNNGTHLFDLLSVFLGNPVYVSAMFNKKTSNSADAMNVDGLIGFKDNIVVTLQSLSKNYGFFGFSIFGERGMFKTTKLGTEILFRKKVRNKNYKLAFELSENAIHEGKQRSMFISTIDHIVSCLEGKSKPISTGKDGYNVLAILLALEKSAKNGGKKIILKL